MIQEDNIVSENHVDFVQNAQGGVVARVKMKERKALDEFPPPDDLSDYEREVWTVSLEELPSKFFRKRNLHLLSKYCRLRANIDHLDVDPTDKEYRQMFTLMSRMESMLGLSVVAEAARQRLVSRMEAVNELRAARMAEARKVSNPTSQGESERPAAPHRNRFNFTAGMRAA